MPQPAVNREQLITRLSRVFEQQGYAGATMSQLASAAGLGKASLYHYFPGGKQEMAESLLHRAIGELERLAFSHLRGNATPADRLDRFVNGFAAYLATNGGYCLVAALASGEQQEELRQAIALEFKGWQERLADTLTEAGRKPGQARRRASQVLDQLYGSIAVGRMLGDPEHAQRALKRLAKQLRKGR